MSNEQSLPEPESILVGHYDPSTDGFDEVFRGNGEVRPAWTALLPSLNAIGAVELTRRWSRAREEVRENFVTYNAHDADSEKERPWELDALPMLIDSTEWRTLSEGVIQRAELLNRILEDLYGAQDLLTSGHLPAEWLFNHPGFRRRFYGQHSEDRPFLYTYAADLARGKDGQWWVVGDRTDSPFGLGYALENRVATSRMLPNLIRKCHVERLAEFFMKLQETLRRLAPAHRENPRVVLLSYGPKGPNYFEDAYLARYLGYTLVEGADLTVRDDHVYLKTLSGLLPVDVIWRRMSDEYCDPLEVRSPESIGVPGLLRAARAGNVAVANAMGASLLESPSLFPFLPGIARHLQGRELALPSVATWWCGQEAARRQVELKHDQLVIRAAYRVAREEAIPAEELKGKTRDELLQLIDMHPSDFVAQELTPRATAPVWSASGAIESQSVALRVYLVAHNGSYQVMPGGLVRMAPQSRSLDGSILGGGVSKDTWVLATGPVPQVSLLPTSQEPIALRRSGAEVPSRVADNLYWFGRQVERAQAACRLLRPVVAFLTSEGDLDDALELPLLIRCLATNGLVEPGFAVEELQKVLPTIAQALPTASLDETQPGSLRATFEQAYSNASSVRDRLSLDSWRIVHRIGRRLIHAASLPAKSNRPSLKPRFGLVELDELLDELTVEFAALDGLFSESMTRTPSWRFLGLGRRLERAQYTVLLVQSLLGSETYEEPKVLESFLRVADSLMTYRSRYLASVHLAPTLDLLLTDDTNPRSLIHQLIAIADHVENLPHGQGQPLGTPEERITASLVHSVRMLTVEDLEAAQEGKQSSKVGRLLQRIADQLPKLSERVSHRYFIHAGRPQQLAEERRANA